MRVYKLGYSIEWVLHWRLSVLSGRVTVLYGRVGARYGSVRVCTLWMVGVLFGRVRELLFEDKCMYVLYERVRERKDKQ